MTSKLTRERLQEIAEDGFLKHGESKELARMALAAMDSSESVELPLDHLQGHKDGLEWAAQLAEANHPETGDWLYDDPIELSKAIRKGPDMPPVQPVADSEPVAEVLSNRPGNDTSTIDRALPVGTQLYRHAQPAPVVPELRVDWQENEFSAGWNACRAALLQASPVCTCPSGDGSLRWPCPVHPGNSPAIPDGYVMVPVEPTKEILDEFDSIIDYGAEDSVDAWHRLLAAAPQSPGSEPATVPGKWIPVSERLPEDSGRYWCYVEEQNDPGKSHYQWNCSWNGDRWWVESEGGGIVTHWMPLPAAPQEVNRE
ncbi:DUF551 domain-containing protein [Klebsiella pneumoniae]|nr:DUF551 domain-containing protein [Klebsiella pneumoniae]EKX4706429.1 DUF551 domain-containing protein [Klebsiella pneumoniae]MCM6006296.1 DUF551 domain-containing protein [Klebsiella pneumoniae]HBR6875106.1 DUF551 domain-containing protein [Klebsiella pneumoniae]